MAEYFFSVERLNISQLDNEIRAAPALASLTGLRSRPGLVRVVFPGPLTATDLALLQRIVDTHTPVWRKPRSILEIFQDVLSLDATRRGRLFALVAAALLRDQPRLARLINEQIEGDTPTLEEPRT